MTVSDKLSGASMRVSQPGPPDSLEWIEEQLEVPGAKDIIIRHEAIGLNYHDIYVRNGEYRTMAYPGVPGIEAAGIVERVGADVDEVRIGDRIAYVTAGYGAYATRRVLPAAQALPLPDAITFDIAAASLLKGLTADMLLTRLRVLAPGAVVVIHAAAGGVGQILTQMAKALGLTVIGAVGSKAKAALASGLGCDRVMIYGQQDLGEVVREVSNGIGADIVFDGVGAATFDASLACLRPFGHLALFGQASGSVPAVEFARLASRSLSVSRPVVFHHVAEPARYRRSGARVFGLIETGAMTIAPPKTYALREAALAHRDLESGQTSGSTIFIPQSRRAAG